MLWPAPGRQCKSPAFVRWIEAAGYRLAGGSRELYHDYDPAFPEAGITELQFPIAR